MKGKNTDRWSTPVDVFEDLSHQYGPFDLDAAAEAHNTKCRTFISPEANALTTDWSRLGSSVWVNPPYSQHLLKAFVQKAALEAEKGLYIFMLLPNSTGSGWFHDYVKNNPKAFYDFRRGRIKFNPPPDFNPPKGWKNSPRGDVMYVIFNYKKNTKKSK